MPGSLRLLCLRRPLSLHAKFTADPSVFRSIAGAANGRSNIAAVSSKRIRWLSVNSNAVGDTREASTTTSTPSDDDDDEALNKALSVSDPATNNILIEKSSSSKAYRELAKAKLSALVVATTAAGFLAAGGPISTQLDVLAACVVGTTLCSSSAAAWNQIFEVNRDSKMKRTQQRPLVNGSLTIYQATTAASVWGIAGTSLLALGTDPVTTALGAGNIILYGGIYTHMKPVSIYNTWVGAVVGAIPPVMGWTAATGGSIMDVEALLLGSLLYFWQMPHFFALSFMHRADYKRGGFQMLPCTEEDGERTAGVIVRNAWYLSAIPIVASLTDVTHSMFALEGMALNAYALTVAHRFHRERTNANARKIFLTSLWYLPSILMLFLLHSKTWDKQDVDEKDAAASFLHHKIHALRDMGRGLCVHETVVASKTKEEGEKACPIIVGKKEVGHVVDTATTAAVVALASAENNSTATVTLVAENATTPVDNDDA